MHTSSAMGKKELEDFIGKQVPRDALMAFQDAYFDGDAVGRQRAAPFAKGHQPSAAGQVKHFVCNETFHEALVAHGAQPTPLSGTRPVVGRLGIFNIARLNVPGHKWTNLKRSKTRRQLAEVNAAIENKFVQADFFSNKEEVANGTIFILGVMDGMDANGLAQLTQVMIALPAPDLKSWLYLNTLKEFILCYDRNTPTVQPDNAKPTLKQQPKKQTGDDQGDQ
jgi:hypothetical protein